MKILFLGTSAGWPLPRLGCQCEICQSKDPLDTRLRPSVLVNDKILPERKTAQINNHQGSFKWSSANLSLSTPSL